MRAESLITSSQHELTLHCCWCFHKSQKMATEHCHVLSVRVHRVHCDMHSLHHLLSTSALHSLSVLWLITKVD